MKIAVTSQNFRTITPHAGRTRRFLVYEATEGGEPVEVDRLDLPKELSMHEFHADGPHPLDAVDVIIAGSFGEGFATRIAARGIVAVATDLTYPIEAVKEYLGTTAVRGRTARRDGLRLRTRPWPRAPARARPWRKARTGAWLGTHGLHRGYRVLGAEISEGEKSNE